MIDNTTISYVLYVVSLKALTRTRSNFTRCTSKTKCWVVYSCTARKRSCLHDIAMWRRRPVRAAASSYRRRLPTRCRVVLAAAPVIVDWLRPPAAARPPTSSSPAIGRAQRWRAPALRLQPTATWTSLWRRSRAVRDWLIPAARPSSTTGALIPSWSGAERTSAISPVPRCTRFVSLTHTHTLGLNPAAVK